MEGISTFGEWVKHRRKALGLTQANLAQRVACSKSMINKIESGLRSPARPTIELLALHLKIQPADYAGFVRLARPHLLIEPGDFSESKSGTVKSSLSPEKIHPFLLTPLLGREREIATVSFSLQQTGIRLLTLTGPGGVGKTHLALKVADKLKDRFRDGVHFVSLASVRNAALVLSTIAQALGLQSLQNQRDDERLSGHLHERAILLILDNFEQVLPAAPAIVELLALTKHLKVLVTSRTVLRVSCEHEFVVPPLKAPDQSLSTDPGRLAQVPAVQLFVQRAQAVRAGFALDDENARNVAQICTRLDGLPLANMLAAARAKVLSTEAILTRLEENPAGALDFLASRVQDLPARHQAIRHTIDWSYSLLSEDEQALFMRLSVFAGGCTLEAIEAACIRPKAKSSSPRFMDTLDVVTALIDQSLLQQSEGPDGEPRFFMSGLLHEYAAECLNAHGETENMRYQHASYFLGLADSIRPELQGAEYEACLKRLDADHDNIRAALSWSSSGDAEMALRMASGLWEFWLARGHWNEGRAWMADILQRTTTTRLPHVRAQVLNGAGLLAYVQRDPQAASAYLQESLALFCEIGDRAGEAWALNHLGQILNISGHVEQALAAFEASLQLFDALGARWNSAWVLINLGEISLQKENSDHASQLFSQARQVFGALNHKRGMATATERLARLAFARHDFGQANDLYQESLRLFGEIQDRSGCGWAFHRLGRTAAKQCQKEQALAYLLESLRLFDELDDRWGFALSLVHLAGVVNDLQQSEQAAILFGAADALLADFRAGMPLTERDFVEASLQEARGRSNPDAWAKGRALAGENPLAWILGQSFGPGSQAPLSAHPLPCPTFVL